MKIIDLYDTKSYFLMSLSGYTDDAMIKSFDTQLQKYTDEEKNKEEKDRRPICIFLTSSGGPNDSARGLCERIRLLGKLSDLTIVGIGSVMSNGVNMLLTVSRDKRYITRDTVVMIHQTRGQYDVHLPGPFSANTEIINELNTNHKHCKADYVLMCRKIASATGQDLSKIKSLVRTGHYMYGQEAVDQGFACALLDED